MAKRSIACVLRYADKKDMAFVAAATLAVIVSGANQPAQLIIFGQLLDSFNEASTSKAVRLVQFFALVYVILGAQQLVTATTQAFASTRVAAAQSRKMRDAYFKALLVKPMCYFDTSDQGAIAASIIDSTLRIQDGLGEKLATGIQNVLALVFGLCVSFYYSWQLALVSIAVLPVIVGILTLTARACKVADAAATEAQTQAAATALETMSNLKTVAAFSGERRTLQRYINAAREVASRNLDLSLANGVNAAVIALCVYSTWAVGMWFAAYLIRTDMRRSDRCRYDDDKTPAERCITGGDAMTCFLCILFGGISLLQALPCLATFSIARRQVEKILDVVEDSPAAKSSESQPSAAPVEDTMTGPVRFSADNDNGGPAIVFECVTFAYPSRPQYDVYSRLDMKFEAGRSTALVGQSGSGKSTAIQLILRFYEPTAGRILFDDIDIATIPISKLRSRIGLVSQEATLFAGTVADNIRYGCLGASMQQVVEAAKMANAHDFITALPNGYETQVDDSKLSGGQKQRIAIGRAIVRKPRVLLLDEATSALDIKSEQVVQTALQHLISSADRTTLVIAHRLSTVRSCDIIFVLGADGAICEQGTHNELIAQHGAYYALATTQSLADTTGENAQSMPDSTGESAQSLADATGENAQSIGDAAREGESQTVVAENGHEQKRIIAEPKRNEKKSATPTKVEPIPSTDAKEIDIEAGDGASPEVVTDWVWRMAKGEIPALAAGVTGSVIAGMTQPIVGYLLAEFVAVFFETSRRQMRLKSRFWALIFLAMGGCAALGEILKAWGLARITERVTAEARAATFEALVRLDIGWHDATSAGESSSRLSRDCASINGLVGPRIAQSLAMIVMVFGGLAVSFEASWQLTLVTLGIIPLIVFPLVIATTCIAKIGQGSDDSLDAAGALASEAILGIRTVRALGVESKIVDEFDRRLAIPEAAAVRKGFAAGLGAGVAVMNIMLGAAFQYYIGSIFFRKGWVDFEELMLVLLVIIFLAFGLQAMSGDAIDKAEAMRSAKKLLNLITTPSKIDPLCFDEEPTGYENASSMEFQDVAFAYPTRPGQPVFDGSFSLVIRPGTTVALVGASGSGKSTAIQLLLRFYDVDAGAILVDGVDVRHVQVTKLRRKFGLVSQQPILFAGTVADNMRYGRPEASIEDVIEAAKTANAHDFVHALPEAYETIVGERGIQLSGGQRQRVAIARALVRKPSILLLDEATSALDTNSERIVQAALDTALDRANVTSLIVAHRLSTIKDADVIVVLEKGHVVEQGTHQQLIANEGAYFALVNDTNQQQTEA